eukprot:6206632-Pleurochrysis_carterae.AAC.1
MRRAACTAALPGARGGGGEVQCAAHDRRAKRRRRSRRREGARRCWPPSSRRGPEIPPARWARTRKQQVGVERKVDEQVGKVTTNMLVFGVSASRGSTWSVGQQGLIARSGAPTSLTEQERCVRAREMCACKRD